MVIFHSPNIVAVFGIDIVAGIGEFDISAFDVQGFVECHG